MTEQQYMKLVARIDRNTIAVEIAEGPIVSEAYYIYMTSKLDAMPQDEVDYEEARSELVTLSGELITKFYSTK